MFFNRRVRGDDGGLRSKLLSEANRERRETGMSPCSLRLERNKFNNQNYLKYYTIKIVLCQVKNPSISFGFAQDRLLRFFASIAADFQTTLIINVESALSDNQWL
ncbi:hypothetical protein FJZ31_35965 [Candidatus Poribacteria bacterium]|nr:hypothetical protein [Candidatus Poribacteria bacterium]